MFHSSCMLKVDSLTNVDSLMNGSLRVQGRSKICKSCTDTAE